MRELCVGATVGPNRDDATMRAGLATHTGLFRVAAIRNVKWPNFLSSLKFRDVMNTVP